MSKLSVGGRSSVSYLQRRVKNDQFGAGRNGVVAGVFLHEVHVDEGVGVLLFRGPKRRGCVRTHTYNHKQLLTSLV